MLEGYFSDQSDCSAYVQIEVTCSRLILDDHADSTSEERADLPSAHTRALLALS